MTTCAYCSKPATHKGEGEAVCVSHIFPAAEGEYERVTE